MSVYVCVLCARLVPKAARRGCQIPRNWSDRRLWAAMWMLATTRSAARRAAGTPAVSASSMKLHEMKLFHKAEMDKNLVTGTTATYVPFLSVYMCGLGVRCMCLQRPTSDIFLCSSHLCSDLELAASARLGASKPSESASAPPTLSSAPYSYVLLCLALMCMLGIQIQIECLHSTLQILSAISPVLRRFVCVFVLHTRHSMN